jgi:hypothetical protein
MIKTLLTVRNPFAKDSKMLHNRYQTFALSKNKTFEIEIGSASMYNLFMFSLDLSWRGQDHAGPELHIELFGFELTMKVYDNRHWDYNKGTWEYYEEKH